MHYPYASVSFRSNKSLQEVADLLSKEIMGGIPFIGREEQIWSDIPALYSAGNPFGLRAELGGSPGIQGYEFRIVPKNTPLALMSSTELDDFIREESNRLTNLDYDDAITSKWQSTDLSQYFRFVILGIKALEVEENSMASAVDCT